MNCMNCILIGEAQEMDPSNVQKQHQAEEPRLLDFPHLPDDAAYDGQPRLNKYSSTITRNHDFPGAQVRLVSCPLGRSSKKQTPNVLEQAMLYAAGVPSREAMKKWPQVGVASVWWEGNPCKYDRLSTISISLSRDCFLIFPAPLFSFMLYPRPLTLSTYPYPTVPLRAGC